MQSQALAEQVMGVYKTLELGEIDSLRELYSETVVFEDPAHRVEGLENLLDYFKSMYANVNECEFDFETVVVDEDHIVLTWTMHLSHPRLNRGDTIAVKGSSVLKIDSDKIELHRDYFDLGAMAYEHIPLLGRVVAGVKSRLGQ